MTCDRTSVLITFETNENIVSGYAENLETGVQLTDINELEVSTPGQYEVFLTNATGCESNNVITIVENIASPILDNYSVETINCEGQGQVSGIEVSGGTPPYSISVDETIMSLDGLFLLNQGDHLLEITDANGCISIEEITLYQLLI